jgi:hypothetical protein
MSSSSRSSNSRKTRKSMRKSKTQISRNPGPNQAYALGRPNEMKIALSYTENFETATTNGLNLDRVFNLNSAFDPYRTGTGHQPREYDQWAAIYNRYRVDRVDVKVVYTNAPSDGAVTSIHASNDANGLTLITDVMEQPFCIWKPFSLGGNGVTLSKTFYLNEITGVSYSTYRDDDRYQAIISSDPSEIIALHVGFNCRTAFTTNIYVQMKQYITFFDPNYVSQS